MKIDNLSAALSVLGLLAHWPLVMRDLSAVCVRVTDIMVRSDTSRQLNEIVTLHIKHVQLALLGSRRSHTSFLAYIYNDLCSLRWCI